jgi:hypothetical protein
MATRNPFLTVRINHGFIDPARVRVRANKPSGGHVMRNSMARDRDFFSAVGDARFYSKQHFGVPEKNHETH